MLRYDRYKDKEIKENSEIVGTKIKRLWFIRSQPFSVQAYCSLKSKEKYQSQEGNYASLEDWDEWGEALIK